MSMSRDRFRAQPTHTHNFISVFVLRSLLLYDCNGLIEYKSKTEEFYKSEEEEEEEKLNVGNDTIATMIEL